MADAPNTNDELYPIAVLIDELKVWRCPKGSHSLDKVYEMLMRLSMTMYFSASMQSTDFLPLLSP